MAPLELAVRAITSIFLSTQSLDVFPLVTRALYMIGLWGIFQKCGIKPWKALLPVARETALGEAAGMEREGRVLAAITLPQIILHVCRAFYYDTGRL